jgi:hypothetical protein
MSSIYVVGPSEGDTASIKVEWREYEVGWAASNTYLLHRLNHMICLLSFWILPA